MRKRFLFQINLLLLIGVIAISGKGQAQAWVDTVQQIDALFQEVNAHTPGASLTISMGEHVVYDKVFGMANLEYAVPFTGRTVTEAGSVSKQFTATAILLLSLEGALELDAEVQQYIPELPQYERPITVKHLLTHTSGLKDWGVLAALGGWPRGTRVYTNDLALDYIVRQPTLNHTPGAEYLYSNSNYTLLTLIVERVSGKSLAEFTRKHFFEPLGMHQTAWRTDYTETIPERAAAYSSKDSGRFVLNMPFENTYGHAALLTTTRDLTIWNTCWQSHRLGKELSDLRGVRGVLNNGDTIVYTYGGVMIDKLAGHRAVFHGGSTAGYRAALVYFPESDLSIAVLSNDANSVTSKVNRGLFSLLLNQQPATVSPKRKTTTKEQAPYQYRGDKKQLVGTYVSLECDGAYQVVLSGDSLWLEHEVLGRKLIQAIKENRFKVNAGVSIDFVNSNVDEQITGFYFQTGRARNVWFKRLEDTQY